MISAKQAQAITQKQYSPIDIKSLYNTLEEEIIKSAKQGFREVFYLIPQDTFLTRKDARNIKRYLKQHGFTFVEIETDIAQSISFCWWWYSFQNHAILLAWFFFWCLIIQNFMSKRIREEIIQIFMRGPGSTLWRFCEEGRPWI